jgi:hypothetical protein
MIATILVILFVLFIMGLDRKPHGRSSPYRRR